MEPFFCFMEATCNRVVCIFVFKDYSRNKMTYIPNKRRLYKLFFIEIVFNLSIFIGLYYLLSVQNEKANGVIGLIIMIFSTLRIIKVYDYINALFKNNSILIIEVKSKKIVLNFKSGIKETEFEDLDCDVVKDDNFNSFLLYRLIRFDISDIVIYQNEMELKISGYVFCTADIMKEIVSLNNAEIVK